MSRMFVDDITGTNPLALLTAGKLATISNIVAPVPQYLVATAANTLTVIDDCVISIGGSGIFKTTETILTTSDLDTGSSFIVGKNYYVYICDLGEEKPEKYVISLNSTYPAGYSAGNSRKIGGFHYGKCRNATAALQPINTSGVIRGTGWESNVFDGILPRSVWTLSHRPKCSPEGMVYLGGGTWVDIYLSSDDGAGGLASAHNATPLTGTEGLNWYSFVERAAAVGKRLLTYEEFCQMALGSPQGLDGANTNAWSATTNTGRQLTGYVANAVSSIGTRDAVGDVWEWLNEFITRYDASGVGAIGTFSWRDVLGAGNGMASMNADYQLIALLAGGLWFNGVRAGARAVNCYNYPWHVDTSFGSRCASDSL